MKLTQVSLLGQTCPLWASTALVWNGGARVVPPPPSPHQPWVSWSPRLQCRKEGVPWLPAQEAPASSDPWLCPGLASHTRGVGSGTLRRGEGHHMRPVSRESLN